NVFVLFLHHQLYRIGSFSLQIAYWFPPLTFMSSRNLSRALPVLIWAYARSNPVEMLGTFSAFHKIIPALSAITASCARLPTPFKTSSTYFTFSFTVFPVRIS